MAIKLKRHGLDWCVVEPFVTLRPFSCILSRFQTQGSDDEILFSENCCNKSGILQLKTCLLRAIFLEVHIYGDAC